MSNDRKILFRVVGGLFFLVGLLTFDGSALVPGFKPSMEQTVMGVVFLALGLYLIFLSNKKFANKEWSKPMVNGARTKIYVIGGILLLLVLAFVGFFVFMLATSH